MEKVWEIKDPGALLRSIKAKRVLERPLPDEKDPAKAYSLSLVLWGGGQIYNDQLVKGIAFLTLMVVFFVGTFASILFRAPLLRYLRTRGVSPADAFLAAEVLVFCVVLFWQFNAGDAYHGAVKARRRPFKGIENRLYPPLCSLLVPGWGQFLNGQQIKGSVYSGLSALAFFSVLSVPATLLAWPFLDASDARFYIDTVLAVSLLFLPLVPLIWLFGCYDAYKVSSDDLLKESLWERIKAANNRRRTQGWVRGVFPRIKSTFVLAVLLACFVTAVYYYSPKSYYADQLAYVRARLAEQGMTVAPDLIGRLLSLIQTSTGKFPH